MKILFSGCSLVYGAEIDFSERFSALVCNELGAEEYNIAYGGRGNDMSLLMTLTEAERIKPDYIVFGLTYLHRTVGLRNPDVDISKIKLGDWEDGTYYDNHQETYQINLHMCDPGVPMKDKIQAMVPVFQNELATYSNLIGILSTLERYSQRTGIPVCVFPAVRINKVVPSTLNGIDLSNTAFGIPFDSHIWFNECITLYKTIDEMPEGHPGPLANKEFSKVLLARIKKDLNL